MKNSTPIYSVSLPEYTLNPKPNFAAVGAKLDELLKTHFQGRWIAVRGISLQDHPGKTRDELVAIITKLGTDRYDPARPGVHDDIDKEFGIETHATAVRVGDHLFCPHYTGDRLTTGSVMGEVLIDCYEGAIVDRGYALRLDIVLVYDLDQLVAAPMMWQGDGPVYVEEPISPQETCTFRFKDPEKKREALLGIIKIA